MIASALGRCEFRTYQNNKEIREGEYYMWNYSPNANESSTVFLHKLVAKLYMYNEALVVETLPQKHTDALVVADSWDTPEAWPSRQNEYKNIVVGDYRYQYPIWENNVLHFKLNHTDIRPVLNGLYESYSVCSARRKGLINGTTDSIGKCMSNSLRRTIPDGWKISRT